MLYLEDFLELIDPLPQELRERFTELRTLDLEVQNAMDKLKTREDRFFANASGMTTEERCKEAAIIKQEYGKMEEISDEKVRIATGMHELVARYERRLQAEIAKFKLELEADNPGISDQLQRKVRDAEMCHRNMRKERRRKIKVLDAYSVGSGGGGGDSLGSLADAAAVDSIAGVVDEQMQMPIETIRIRKDRLGASLSSPSTSSAARGDTSLLRRRGGTDLDVGLSMEPSLASPGQLIQPHHSQSLDVRSPPASAGVMGPPMTPHSAVLPSFTAAHESRHGRPRKFTSRVQEMVKASMAKREAAGARVLPAGGAAGSPSLAALSTSNSSGDASGFLGGTSFTGETPKKRRRPSVAAARNDEDSDEGDEETQRKWCICQQASYGNMVACDSGECPFEWFHYDCVGVTQPPKGKWFCPHCVHNMKRRHSSKHSSPEPSPMAFA